MARIRIYTESTAKKAFASALDWPGWARAAKTEDLAIQALADYASRYEPVAVAAGVRWPASLDFEVAERLTGSGSTDFGVLDKPPKADPARPCARRDGRPATPYDASPGMCSTTPGRSRTRASLAESDLRWPELS